MKLIISKNNNNTWNKFIIDLINNEVIFEHSGISLFDESKEYFDKVVHKTKLCYPGIIEVERFI